MKVSRLHRGGYFNSKKFVFHLNVSTFVRAVRAVSDFVTQMTSVCSPSAEEQECSFHKLQQVLTRYLQTPEV